MNYLKKNVGTVAICMNIAGDFTNLTIGKGYEVLDEGPRRVTVKDDMGDIHSFDKHRFGGIRMKKLKVTYFKASGKYYLEETVEVAEGLYGHELQDLFANSEVLRLNREMTAIVTDWKDNVEPYVVPRLYAPGVGFWKCRNATSDGDICTESMLDCTKKATGDCERYKPLHRGRPYEKI